MSAGTVVRAGLVTLLVLGVGVTGALILYKRLDSGSWKMPTGSDLVRIKQRLTRHQAGPTRVIYLDRDGETLRGGPDDAPGGISSVVASSGLPQVKIPRFKGSTATWNWIVTCVKKKFEPFDVAVTDQRPTSGDYILVAVGGSSGAIHAGHEHAGGLAPFSGDPVPDAVVFAFPDELGGRKREICEVIGMEVGHAYGLDHGYYCLDLMTYLPYCGVKRFQDKAIPCGEKAKRPCAGGAATQNSFQHLMKVLGPARK